MHEVLRSPGQPIDTPTRTFMESRLGQELGSVRIHKDARAAASARALGASAYTVGQDVVFGRGAHAPGTQSGRFLLAHELTHVLQQRSLASGPILQKQEQPPVSSEETRDEPAPSTPPPPRYRIRVIGHASPRWRRPGASTEEQRNLALSQRRAREVEAMLRHLLQNRQPPVELSLSSELEESDLSSIATDARGMSETLEEAGGDRESNASELRRVDIEVDVLQTAFETGGFSEAVTLPTATDRWEIRVDIIEGAAGAAGTIGQGALRNRDTGQTVAGRWYGGGGGGGIDLPIPSVSPGSWTHFETVRPVTFAAFRGSPIRLTSLAIGVGIGYGTAEFRFTNLMDHSVTLSGITFNQWGIGGSVTAGPWNFTRPIPPAPTDAREHRMEFPTTVGTQFGHRVRFPTGVDTITDPELSALADFLDRLP